MPSRSSLPLLLTFIVSAGAMAACDSSTVTSGPTPSKCDLSLAMPTRMVASGGTGTISVTAQPECGWNVSTQAPWISGLSPTSGQGNGTVEFHVAPNPAPSMRQTELIFNDDRVPVSQDPAPCPVTFSPAAQNVGADGGGGQVKISAGCSWTATSSDSWLTITSSESGTGDGTITFSVESNLGDARTAHVRVGGQSAEVVQAGAQQTPPAAPGCGYAISPSGNSVGPDGAQGIVVSISAAAGCSWTADSNASWISLTTLRSGTGNGSVRLNVAPNRGDARSGTVAIAEQTFSVAQATGCTYQLNRTTIQIPPNGNPRAVTVTAPPECTWSASSGAPWLTIIEGANGQGSGTVRVSAGANTGPTRTGTMTIAGQSVTVTQ